MRLLTTSESDFTVKINPVLRVAMPANAVFLTRWIEVFFGSSLTGPSFFCHSNYRFVNFFHRRLTVFKVFANGMTICVHDVVSFRRAGTQALRHQRHDPAGHVDGRLDVARIGEMASNVNARHVGFEGVRIVNRHFSQLAGLSPDA